MLIGGSLSCIVPLTYLYVWVLFLLTPLLLEHEWCCCVESRCCAVLSCSSHFLFSKLKRFRIWLLLTWSRHFHDFQFVLDLFLLSFEDVSRFVLFSSKYWLLLNSMFSFVGYFTTFIWENINCSISIFGTPDKRSLSATLLLFLNGQ